MKPEELQRRFEYHKPDAQRVKVHEDLRAIFGNVAEAINLLCPEGREQSLAITNLEVALFWANAAVARGG